MQVVTRKHVLYVIHPQVGTPRGMAVGSYICLAVALDDDDNFKSGTIFKPADKTFSVSEYQSIESWIDYTKQAGWVAAALSGVVLHGPNYNIAINVDVMSDLTVNNIVDVILLKRHFGYLLSQDSQFANGE